VETVRALEDLHGGRHLAVGRRHQPKKRTQGDGKSRKKLAAVRWRMTRRAVHARRKGRSYKGPTVEKRRCRKRTSDYAVRGIPKGRTFEEKWRTQLKFNSGIRDRDLKQELCLGSKKTLYKALGQTHELEVVKRKVVISIGLRKISDWRLQRGRPALKQKKRRPKHSPRKRTEMMVVHLDRLAPYQGTAQEGESSGSCWRVITEKDDTRGRRARPSTDVTSAALVKEMAVRLWDIRDE
jgi:hypothetical protein